LEKNVVEEALRKLEAVSEVEERFPLFTLADQLPIQRDYGKNY